MSILKYFHPVKLKPDLPDHNGPLCEKMPFSAILSEYTKVMDVLEKRTSSSQGPYCEVNPTSIAARRLASLFNKIHSPTAIAMQVFMTQPCFLKSFKYC